MNRRRYRQAQRLSGNAGRTYAGSAPRPPRFAPPSSGRTPGEQTARPRPPGAALPLQVPSAPVSPGPRSKCHPETSSFDALKSRVSDFSAQCARIRRRSPGSARTDMSGSRPPSPRAVGFAFEGATADVRTEDAGIASATRHDAVGGRLGRYRIAQYRRGHRGERLSPRTSSRPVDATAVGEPQLRDRVLVRRSDLGPRSDPAPDYDPELDPVGERG